MTFLKIVESSSSPQKPKGNNKCESGENNVNERKEVFKLAKEMKLKLKRAKKQKQKQHFTSSYIHSPYYEEWSTLVNNEIDKDIDRLNETKWNNLMKEMDEFITLPHLYQYFILAIEYYLDNLPTYLSDDEQMEYHFIIDYLEYEQPNLNVMADHYLQHRLDLLGKPINFYTQTKRVNGTFNEQKIIHELVRGYATLEFLIN